MTEDTIINSIRIVITDAAVSVTNLRKDKYLRTLECKIG